MASEEKPEAMPPERTCFVIGPIGKPNTPQRIAADFLLHLVIKPVLEDKEFAFKVVRADQVAEPGLITAQVISLVMESALVVADLTDHNANAFYELAIRHMEEGRTIHMIRADQDPPFDLKDYRAIPYMTDRVQAFDEAKTLLLEQVRAVLAPNYVPSNPITHARGRRKLAGSSDPVQKIVADLVDAHVEMRGAIHQLGAMVLRVDERLGSIEDRRGIGGLSHMWNMPKARTILSDLEDDKPISAVEILTGKKSKS